LNGSEWKQWIKCDTHTRTRTHTHTNAHKAFEAWQYLCACTHTHVHTNANEEEKVLKYSNTNNAWKYVVYYKNGFLYSRRGESK
jgi:hypothetical protein